MNDSIPDRSDELLLTRIRRIRGLLRRSVVEARLSTLVAVMIPILLVMATIDFLFRLPSPVRWMMLLAGAIWLGFEVHRRVWPAIRFRPSLIDVALRIESMTPSVAGRLASAIDFANLSPSERNPLADRSLSDLRRRATTVRLEAVVDATSAHRRFGLALLAIVVITGLSVWRPSDASIATRRIFAPWTDARWPARTDIASAVDAELVHPRGEPLALAADLIKGDPGSERVSVRLRTIRDGNPDPCQRRCHHGSFPGPSDPTTRDRDRSSRDRATGLCREARPERVGARTGNRSTFAARASGTPRVTGANRTRARPTGSNRTR